jgi:predicted permease
LPSFDSLLQDLRYTLRTLRRDAGFTVFAILIVGLGIGASSTIFSIVNAVLLRPLPFQDPDRLVWIANHDSSGLSGQTTQVDHLLDLREHNRSFTDIAGYFSFYGVGDNKLTGQGEPERLSGVPVSANFFQLLGVQPRLGRLFTAEECKWNGPKAVLLSDGLWRRRFASDPAIVGKKLTINEDPVAVVGVLPPTFDFASVFAPGSHFDLYFPFPLSPETNRWGNTMAMIGRLKPGVSVSSAQAEVTVLAGNITRAHPERNVFEGKVGSLSDHVDARIRPALIVLACAVGVVMLIVCANLSNLLLARTATRQKEMAIRTALGAGRRRLIRQMLTESIVLSCCGAVVGIVIAYAGTRVLTHLDALSIPLLQTARIDFTSLGLILAMAVVTGLFFGLAPALQSPGTAAVHDALKENTRGAAGGRKRNFTRGLLVVSEIAFACVLLVGAGLLIRSFLRLMDVNLGFQPERAAAIRVDPDRRYSTQAQQNAYFNEVLRTVRDIPGIQAAGLTDALPLGRNRSWGAGAVGVVYKKGDDYPDAFVRIISDGYFRSMGIAFIDGRDLNERDTPQSDPVIVINQTMARTLWPGQNALGKFVANSPNRRVVGIVSDVRHLALEQGAGMEMYIPIRQTGDFGSVDLVVRSSFPSSQMASAVRGALKSVAPNLPANDFRELRLLVDKAVSPRRFVVLLLGGFAAFALILASLGIYAVISYSVSQREQEIGIRMALGASAGDLQMKIVGQTLSIAAIGMLAGVIAAWALAQTLTTFLFGVTSNDPVTFITMLVILTTVAAIAGYLPARRASHIDPVVALRAN